MFKRILVSSVLFLLLLASASFGADQDGNGPDKFLFGVETHLARILDWTDTNRGIPGKMREESYQILLQYIDDLGVSLVRDGSHFDNLMPDENGSLRFETMEKILPDLRSRGIVLNWVIVSTPSWAVDGASGSEPSYNRPPRETAWNTFMAEVAERSKAYSDGIIYELWNEPNLNGFWTGTATEYIRLLDAGAAAVKSVTIQAKAANGGMVIDSNDSEFYTNFKTMLQSGKIDNVTIHSHGTIDTLHSNFTNNVAVHGIENRRIILNESGYPLRDDTAQALHTAGKAIWAIGNGLAGYSAFYLGCVDRAANPDLAEGEPESRDYSLVTDSLTLRPSYTAYKTVIAMLDGAVAERALHQGGGRYEYLFTGKAGQKIYAAIGGQSDAQEVSTSLGTSEYKTYDMMGRENGSAKVIQYFVAGEASVRVPFINRHPLPQSVRPGEAAEFDVIATGAGPFTYQWQKYGGREWIGINGAQDRVYRIPEAQISDSGSRYRVVVTNRAGSVTSEAALLTVEVNETANPNDTAGGGGGCSTTNFGAFAGFCLLTAALVRSNHSYHRS